MEFFWPTLSIPVQLFPQLFALFAIPNILWGVYGLTGRYFVDAKRRTKTYYGVTNERVIIVSGIFRKQVKSIPFNTLPQISLDERSSGGAGTVTFGPEESESWLAKTFSQKEKIVYPSLEEIQDARRVYEIIRNAQKRQY